MGLIGCYDLMLYCDDPEHIGRWDYGKTPWEYNGRDEADCIRQARKVGWLINKKRSSREPGSVGGGYCLCPEHSGKR